MNIRSLAILLSSASLLACQPPQAARDQVAQATTTAEQAVAARQSQVRKASDGVEITGMPFYGRTGSTRRPGQYDTVLNGRIEVTTDAASPISLSEAVRRIEQVTGVPVRLETDAKQASPTPVKADVAAVPQAAVTVTNIMQAMQIGGLPTSGLSEQRYTYQFKGSIREFLQLLASQHGVDWEVRGTSTKAIHIYRQETRTWTLAIGNGDHVAETGIDPDTSAKDKSQGNVSQVNSGSKLTQSAKFESKNWEDIAKSIDAFVLNRGATVSYSPSTWTVTASGAPYIIRELDRYIAELNDRLTRQIDILVSVYTVTVEDSEDVNVDLQLALKSLGDDLRLLTASPVTNIASTAASVTGLFNEDTGPTRALQGTKLVVKALSKLGKTSLFLEKSMRVQNGIAKVFQDVNSQVYAASVAPANQSTNGTSATSIPVVTPGTVTTGLQILTQARALGDGSIHLAISVSNSRLLGPLRTIPQGQGTSIEAPITGRLDDGLQTFWLAPGVPVVYGHYIRDAAETDQTDAARNPLLSLLGGRVFGSRAKTITVVTATATVETRPIGTGNSAN